ncbi:DUF932 domain-containing protein [Nocardia sp. CA-128927]|uniref:DUF932 domain-containing protein n=1 Tax=Nocardia sp. CA-128927 TaxID=3239975 RepID=UPI003D96269E
MSRETSEWLNTKTLIGMTEKRGTAWHYRKDDQGEEPNHYPGFIPVGEVVRRLFNFKAKSAVSMHGEPVSFEDEWNWICPSGQPYVVHLTQAGRQTIYHSESKYDFGVFKSGYESHQFQEWLLTNVAQIVTPAGLAVSTDSLGVTSAGLLRDSAQAWVQIERPDNVTTPEGVEFRSNILAATSHDGSIATQYALVNTVVVCDNTYEDANKEARASGQRFKVRHSKNSKVKLTEARQALRIIVEGADDFAASIAKLCRIDVTTRQFDAFLGEWAPMGKEGAAATRATNKREKLADLYRNDVRVAPWAGTAFGVIQAVNTYNHHYASVANMTRVERNMINAIEGKTAEKGDVARRDLMRVLELV